MSPEANIIYLALIYECVLNQSAVVPAFSLENMWPNSDYSQWFVRALCEHIFSSWSFWPQTAAVVSGRSVESFQHFSSGLYNGDNSNMENQKVNEKWFMNEIKSVRGWQCEEPTWWCCGLKEPTPPAAVTFTKLGLSHWWVWRKGTDACCSCSADGFTETAPLIYTYMNQWRQHSLTVQFRLTLTHCMRRDVLVSVQ